MAEKDECIAAFGAVYEILSEKCGKKKVRFIPLDEERGVLVAISNPSPDPADRGEDLTLEERIRAIEESPWAQGEARGLCEKLFGLTPGTKEYEECVKRVAHKLAIGMVT